MRAYYILRDFFTLPTVLNAKLDLHPFSKSVDFAHYMQGNLKELHQNMGQCQIF